jgi:hypothetical protein
MPTAPRILTLALVAVGVLVGAAMLVGTPILAAAQAPQAQATQAQGPPDPAGLPSRPGMPGPGPGPRPGAPPRDTSARPAPVTGTGVIRGRVIGADTGLPLRRARVTLRPQHGRGESKMSVTDADGSFSFGDLPAGRYDINGSKPRYVDTTLGSRGPNRPGRPVDLADGQKIDGVTLTLPAAGVITGRVFDDAGDVVTGAMVMPMRYRTMSGERQLMPVGRTAQTDDTGTFRIFGLAPGAYYVSARAEEGLGRFGAELSDPSISGFAPTYFPGTAAVDQAQPVEVVAGGEILADLTLVTARLTSISGIVVDAAGAAASGGHIMTGGRSRFFFGGGNGAQIKPDGTFTLSGVPPGEYLLQARAIFGAPAMFEETRGDRSRPATASVTVNGDPVAGVRLVVREPIRVPVITTFEDGGTKPERVFVSAMSPGGEGATARLGPDGRLTLEVAPGSFRVNASAAPPWLVKRVLYRGREVEADEVELTDEPGGRLEVFFTTRSATVMGGVTDRTGKPLADYTVVVLPQDAELTRQALFQYLRMARPDQQGRFRAERMRAGTYVAAAVEDLDMETLQEPEVLDGLRRIGKTFRVLEGETVTLSLTLAALP